MQKNYRKDVGSVIEVKEEDLCIEDYINNPSVKKVVVFKEWLDEKNLNIHPNLREWAKRQVKDTRWKSYEKGNGIKSWFELER